MKRGSKVNLENTSMVIGGILLVFSFVIPFHLGESTAKLLGDSATPFVSAAAFLLLFSANIMQRKELNLQWKELKATREVFTEQSSTMSRQRFEHTFFNMVNLHYTILSDMRIGTLKGRELIQQVFEGFQEQSKWDYRKFKFENINGLQQEAVFYIAFDLDKDQRLIDRFISIGDKSNITPDEKNLGIEEIKKGNLPANYRDTIALDEISREKIYPVVFESMENISILLSLPEWIFDSKHDPILGDDFEIADKDWRKEKVQIYTTFYNKHEYLFGHYYRNLYRIVKYINESDLIDEYSKKEFRGILRAQLSTYELMMLFYNVFYSEKGSKFKKQIMNKNFFDDHLIMDKFVWNDDFSELELNK